MVGAGATTISYTDLMASDLIVLFGSDVANAQPVVMKYLYLARREGTRVAVVNPYREPGLERYWVPSNAESAVFGTKMTDEFFSVNVGGDIAFIAGVLKVLAADRRPRRALHRRAHDRLRRARRRRSTGSGSTSWSGSRARSRADMERFAAMYAAADSAIFVWSMGLTQHAFGSHNVRAVINLALARGNVGRPGAGLMPIRGHSGVQGGAEMGAYATAFPGGVPVTPESAAELSRQWGFDVPDAPGLSAEEMVEAAADGRIEVLYSSGGNFLDVLPDPGLVADRLARAPVRVHQDIVVTTQMLVDPGEVVVLLPAATRYEQRDGGTETTTERRIAFSPQIRGPKVGEARTEWEILSELAERVDPGPRAPHRHPVRRRPSATRSPGSCPCTRASRRCAKTGDQVQWGGAAPLRRLGVPDPRRPGPLRRRRAPRADDPRGPHAAVDPAGQAVQLDGVPRPRPPDGPAPRRPVHLRRGRRPASGVGEGDAILVRSATGEVRARAHIARIRPGNVQMYFPESNRADRGRAPGRERRAGLQRDRRGGPRAMTAWAVFDLNGTLLDPAAIGADALDEAILAGMTLNHVGEYRPFPELLRAAVARVRPPGRGRGRHGRRREHARVPRGGPRPRPPRRSRV